MVIACLRFSFLAEIQLRLEGMRNGKMGGSILWSPGQTKDVGVIWFVQLNSREVGGGGKNRIQSHS